MSEENKTFVIRSRTRPKSVKNKGNRLEDLVRTIQEMNEKEFTGYIKINFTQGGIGRIEKYEEILRGGLSAD